MALSSTKNRLRWKIVGDLTSYVSAQRHIQKFDVIFSILHLNGTDSDACEDGKGNEDLYRYWGNPVSHVWLFPDTRWLVALRCVGGCLYVSRLILYVDTPR